MVLVAGAAFAVTRAPPERPVRFWAPWDPEDGRICASRDGQVLEGWRRLDGGRGCFFWSACDGCGRFHTEIEAVPSGFDALLRRVGIERRPARLRVAPVLPPEDAELDDWTECVECPPSMPAEAEPVAACAGVWEEPVEGTEWPVVRASAPGLGETAPDEGAAESRPVVRWRLAADGSATREPADDRRVTWRWAAVRDVLFLAAAPDPEGSGADPFVHPRILDTAAGRWRTPDGRAGTRVSR